MIKRCSTLAIHGVLGAALLTACGGRSGSGSGDMVAPTATLTSPLNFDDNLTGTLALSATASDDVGVARVEYQVDGRQVASTSTGPTYSASVATGSYAAGQHVVRARARDTAGNVSAWSSATVRFGGSAALVLGFAKNDAWAQGLTAATAMAQAPDGRWFIAEQGGSVRIVQSDGALLTTPFLQLLGVDSADERGLIGLALHPNFASNGIVYVHYTSAVSPAQNVVRRFTANPSNPNIAAVGSEIPILDLPPLGATNHNGGAIHFGIDGKLYVGVGDNGVGANAKNLASPLGKLLRIDDNGNASTDNPFYNVSQNRLANAVWASGLRNPFTFAVQPSTGRIHINDVGEGTWEEINVGAAGANYGWPATEGPTSAAGVTTPLFAYKHSATAPPGSGPGGFFTGTAIAGGAFYPAAGPFPAELHGNYFFADLGSSTIGVIDLANGNAAYAFAHVNGSPVDIQVGADGALYVLTRSAITRISAP